MSILVFIPILGRSIDADGYSLTEAVAELAKYLAANETLQCQSEGLCFDTCKLFNGTGGSSDVYIKELAKSRILLVLCSGVPLCLTIQGIADIQSLRMNKNNSSNLTFGVILVEALQQQGKSSKAKREVKVFGEDGRMRNILKTLCHERSGVLPGSHLKTIMGTDIHSPQFCHDLNTCVRELMGSFASKRLMRHGGPLTRLTF